MVTHRPLVAALSLSIGIVTLSFAAACDKVPLLAPTGSVITLFASSTTVPTNGEVEIIATVIENGTPPASGAPGTPAPTVGSGTPVQNGTLVSFTTTIGVIEPREARTRNGEVRVRFRGNGQSGTATITAYSGGASGVLENVLVGTAAADHIVLSASPQTLGSNGGQATVSARVEDAGGAGLAGVPVTFTSNAGQLSPTSAVTDASGIATTTLTTTAAATVTARTGSKTADLTVGVAANLGLTVAASPNPGNAGVPITFTITTAADSGARNVVINYGDGSTESLGNISRTTTVAKTYSSTGTFTARVTATSPTGDVQSASTAVIVGAVGATISATPSNPTVGTPVTFRATVTGNPPVSRYLWTYDDGTTRETTANEDTRTFLSRGIKTVRVDVFGVNGQLIATSTTQINVS